MSVSDRAVAGEIISLTRTELEALLEAEAQAQFRCSAAEALARIARGEVPNSVGVAELQTLKELLASS